MNRYQRCFSRSLIFFTSLVIILLLIIETNIGFQCIFRITNYFFLGLKIEKISGNWRDFSLKNVNLNCVNFTMKARNIRFLINSQFFLNSFHIIKEIDIKKSIIIVHQNKSIVLKKIKNNYYAQKNIFCMHNFIIDKIKIDTFLLKDKSMYVFFSHISSGVKLDTNHIILSPTYINKINIFLKHFEPHDMFLYKKKITTSSPLDIFHAKKMLNAYSAWIKYFFSLSTDIDTFKCKYLNYFYNDKQFHISNILSKINIKNNIFKIHKIQANFNHVMIYLHGRFVLNENSSFSYVIKNKLFFNNTNKIITVFITGMLDDRFSFNIYLNHLFKIHIKGEIFFTNLNNSFYLQCDMTNLYSQIYKKILFNVDFFHFIVKGNFNSSSFSLQSLFSTNRKYSIYSEIKGHSDIKNIFIDKLNILPIKKNIFYKRLHATSMQKLEKTSSLWSNKSLYKSKWFGHFNILGDDNRNSYNFFMPNINIQGSVMEKKISILGSLYYKNLNMLETSGLNFFLGHNKILLKGILGNEYNLHSCFNVHNLDYFLPDLNGSIIGQAHLSGMSFSPIFNAKILGKNLRWNNVYLKSIKILSNMHKNNPLLNYILVDIKNFYFTVFKINSLYIKYDLENNKQKNLYILLQNKNIYMNIIFHSFINDKNEHWYGTFKKIHINNILGDWFFLNSPFFHYIFKKNSEKHNIIQTKKNMLSSIFPVIKNKILQLYDTKLLNIQYQFSFDTALKWIPGHFMYKGQFFLVSNSPQAKKKVKQININNKVKSLNLHSMFQNGKITISWLLEYLNKRMQSSLLSGVIHIQKIGNEQKINGYCRMFRVSSSTIKYFMTNYPDIQKGTITGKLQLSGNIWNPRIFSDVNVYSVMIKSNNLFKYMSFCLHSFFKKIENIKINQVIYIKNGHIFFTLDLNLHHSDIEWSIFFNSHDMTISLFPYIYFPFFPNVKLHYLSSKYDLIGNIKFLFFILKINEKNIIF